MNDLNKTTKSLDEMSMYERMEYQRMHDNEIILQASMRRMPVELKTLANKRKHPFAIENIKDN